MRFVYVGCWNQEKKGIMKIKVAKMLRIKILRRSGNVLGFSDVTRLLGPQTDSGDGYA